MVMEESKWLVIATFKYNFLCGGVDLNELYQFGVEYIYGKECKETENVPGIRR